MDNLNDGTVASAAEAIAAAREVDPPAEVETDSGSDTQRHTNRGDGGRFAKAEQSGQESEATEDNPGKSAADKGGDEQDDEDYLELETPGEEGAEPKRERFKVSEVFAGYQRSKELETELEQAKARGPLGVEAEVELEGLITERGRYMEALQSWAQMSQPRPPSRDLLNPASQNYNPELYYQQMQQFDEVQANQAKVQEEIGRVQKQNEEQQNVLLASKLARERAKLTEIWPEVVKDKAVAQKFAADLEKLYGVDGATLKSVSDHRFYALAKDALAYRAQETAKKEAARVVLGKPKLVRANARTSKDPKATAFDGAMGRLSQSNSLDDAAAAIAALR